MQKTTLIGKGQKTSSKKVFQLNKSFYTQDSSNSSSPQENLISLWSFSHNQLLHPAATFLILSLRQLPAKQVHLCSNYEHGKNLYQSLSRVFGSFPEDWLVSDLGLPLISSFLTFQSVSHFLTVFLHDSRAQAKYS